MAGIESILIFSNQWANAALMFFGFVILGQLFLWITKNVVLYATRKTKTELDDLIVEAAQGPLLWLITLFGLKVTLNILGSEFIFIDTLNNFVNTAIYITVIILFSRIINVIINVWGHSFAAKTKSQADDTIIILLHKAISVTIWVLGALYILSTWGIQITPLLASLGVAGIAIAFALQETLSNIFGGISVILDKNLYVGEVIDVGGDGLRKGTVMDIGMRSTKIKTFDNEEMIIPNSQVANSVLINAAEPSKSVRVVIPFGVAYGSDPDKVKKLVRAALEKYVPDMLKDPEPHIKFLEMGDSSLNFKAYFYIGDYRKKLGNIDLANTVIYKILNKNKIEIPFPQMDVHMKK